MKINIYKLVLVISVLLISCDENKFLEETPFSFYSPENSFETPEQLKSTEGRLYRLTRDVLRGTHLVQFELMQNATDLFHRPNYGSGSNNRLAYITPQSNEVSYMWRSFYQIIFTANVIIDRLGDVDFEDENERNELEATAKFFRAFAYRFLGSCYGGVPLVLHESKGPKRDFESTTREQVWEQCISDLTYASQNLPEWNSGLKDGKISKAAADHLMAEIYINLKQWDNAISAASAVIDNPDYYLMTERFGSKPDEIANPEYNSFWDLYRNGNQNRSSGNHESIGICEYEYLLPGGDLRYSLPRFTIPVYRALKDEDGVSMFFATGCVQYGGRTINWLVPTDYLRTEIWSLDTTDLRGKSPCLLRDIKVTNPASKYYGKWYVADGVKDLTYDPASDPWERNWNVFFAKFATFNDMPDDFIADKATGETTKAASFVNRDSYYFRLAETYLLRAEAYLGKGDADMAASDINVVRRRAEAREIAASEVNIDFILDERARELTCEEEPRVLTLMRLGKSNERTAIYNPHYNGKYDQSPIDPRHELFPIPASEIELNTQGTLNQNPGYPN